jgi:hypothetical protein
MNDAPDNDENRGHPPPTPSPAAATQRRHRRRHERLFAVALGFALLTGSPWWVKPLLPGASSKGTNGVGPTVGFSGGCAPFQVYAQNRWLPVGAAVRAAPSALSVQVGSYPPNMVIAVNGWVEGRVAYPTNVPPFNSDIWFHVADGLGWVSFAGVRAVPTSFDPTAVANGGPPAAAPAQCEGAVR